MTALEGLFAPRTPAEFLRDVWGKRFERVPGHPEKFTPLLEWDALNGMIEDHAFDPMRLRLVKDGKQVSRGAYMDEQPFPQVRSGDLVKQLREGATLNINVIDRMHAPIRALRDELAALLREPVGVNLYAGWRTRQGFDVHWDEHDVLVLQVAGRKQWKVWGDSRPYPISHALDGDFAPSTELAWEGVIEQGDLLYIPRGWWHVAVPMDEPSLHLSFGIDTHTGRNLLLWLVDQATSSSEWVRRDLPRRETEEARREHVARLREAVLAQLSDDVLERYQAHRDAKAAPPRASAGLPWSALATLPETGDWLVRLAASRDAAITELPEEGRVQLVAGSKQIRLPAVARPILEALRADGPVAISAVTAAAGGVAPETVRSLLGKLAAQGLLTVVGPAAIDEEMVRGHEVEIPEPRYALADLLIRADARGDRHPHPVEA